MVEEADTPNLPVVLSILWSVMGVASCTPHRAAEVQGNLRRCTPSEVPSVPVNLSCSCSSWLMIDTGGCKLGTLPPTDKYPLCMVCLRVHHTSRFLATSTQTVGSQSPQAVRLYASSDACNKPQCFWKSMMHPGPLPDPPPFSKIRNPAPKRKTKVIRHNHIADSLLTAAVITTLTYSMH